MVRKVLGNSAVEGVILSSAIFVLSFSFGAVSGVAEISPANDRPPLCYVLTVNLGLCIIMLLSGLFFGVPSTALLSYNGYVLGAKFKSSLIAIGVEETVIRTFPHLVSETIALVLAASVGTTVIVGFIRKIEVDRRDLLLIAVLAIIMTLVSGYIEVYVTHSLIEVVRWWR